MSETNLAVVLEIDTKYPADFYRNPVYKENILKAIAVTSNLVYEINDAGEKEAKANAVFTRKFAAAYDEFRKKTVKVETQAVKAWDDEQKALIAQLRANPETDLALFSEMRAAKLIEVKIKLQAALEAMWDAHKINPEYREGNVDDLVTLSALTATGALAKAARDGVQKLANKCLEQQTQMQSRVLVLENMCFKAGINPPFTKDHIGTDFYGDTESFLKKANTLINAEKKRIESIQAELERKSETEMQKKIDAALAKAREEAALAIDSAQKVREEAQAMEKEDSKKTNIEQARKEAAERLREFDARKAEYNERVQAQAQAQAQAPSAPGKHDVTLTITLCFQGVGSNVTNEQVIAFFNKQIQESNPKLFDKIIDVNAV